MAATSEVHELLKEIAAVEGVRGVMLATAKGPVGVEHAHLSLAVATDVVKTVRRLAVASTTANAPLRELLINFGPSRMMLRPLAEDVLVVLLEREIDTGPIRALLDLEIGRILRVMRGQPAEEPMAAYGLDDTDDDIGALLASPLGPILREIEAVYHSHRRRGGFDQAQTRSIMHEQMREWLLCCNPSNYTLPLLLDGLSETMVDDPSNRNRFVGEAQGILRKSGALR